MPRQSKSTNLKSERLTSYFKILEWFTLAAVYQQEKILSFRTAVLGGKYVISNNFVS